MEHKKLIELVQKTFASFEKPQTIYKKYLNEGPVTEGQIRLQTEFYNRDKSELSRHECGIIIFENGTISDEAYFYFLSRLCEAVFFEGADEFLFYSHLQNIRTTGLTEEQIKVLRTVIDEAKAIEANLEAMEEAEEKAWKFKTSGPPE